MCSVTAQKVIQVQLTYSETLKSLQVWLCFKPAISLQALASSVTTCYCSWVLYNKIQHFCMKIYFTNALEKKIVPKNKL